MNSPTCRELIDFLSDYIAGELPAETKTAFEQHLSHCPECVFYVENFRMTVAGARAAFEDPPSPMPEELVQAILKSARESG